ncbi:MAG TPA: D-amino-acid transaminase [Candidatus Salinicoccus merdavium]|nr:D-amino-acid transaminase [Candidatus Salinicoccus merdavium]
MRISYYNGRYMNHEEMSIKSGDRAFYFGDGVYEVIRIYDGNFFTFDEHVDRLLQSAEEILIKDVNRTEVVEILREIKERNAILNGALYIQVSRGIAPRDHGFPDVTKPVIYASIREAKRPLSLMNSGVEAVTAEDYRWLKCHVKSLNLLANVMEKQHAVEQGAKETILHRDGVVTEGSSTNVFMVKNEVLFTHPANNLILNGITRRVVLGLAEENDISVREEGFTVSDMSEADEVFYTSTTQEIIPVVKVDGRPVDDGSTGRITQNLQEYFNKKITQLNSVK